MPFRSLLLATLFVASVSPALATETIFCASPDGEASLSLNAGRLSVLSINNASLQVGKRSWSTHPDLFPGTPMAVGQAFADSGKMLVSLVDENVEGIIAELRVFSAEEGEDWVQAGVLRVAGIGAFPVNCSGD